MNPGIKVQKTIDAWVRDLELDIDLIDYYVTNRTYGVEGSMALLHLRSLLQETIYRLKGTK